MRKKTSHIFLMLFSLIIILLICAFACLKFLDTDVKVKSTNIKTDTNMVQNNFPNISGVERCYWTVDIVGDERTVGPQSYKFRAIIIINENEAKRINDTYEFVFTDIGCEKKLLPKNLMYELNLYYSEDLSKTILGTLWIGEVYFDYNNRLLYLEAVNI